MGLSSLFPDTADATGEAQFFMMVVYGYILYTASNLISDGSEMLLCVYGPGIIGGLLIPILGAVPDGAIILLSGLGDNAQESLSVGVGTLAGSTIMLLTIPWAASVYIGRRDLDERTGEAATQEVNGRVKPKLTHFSWTTNVVTTSPNVVFFAKIMMVTSLSFLIIQIPAFFDKGSKDAAGKEAPFALAGLIVTVLGFVAFCAYQLLDAKHEEYVMDQHREAQRAKWKESLKYKVGSVAAFEEVFDTFDVDNSDSLDRAELQQALRCLGLDVDRREVNTILKELDVDNNGEIDRDEFASVVAHWLNYKASDNVAHIKQSGSYEPVNKAAAADHDDEDEEEERKQTKSEFGVAAGDGSDVPLVEAGGGMPGLDEEEEEEEEYMELTDAQIKMRAFGLLGLGTVLVSVFSDPMVDVLGDFGKTINVPAFYVSFVVTPLASNASEVISAMVFARKRTNRAQSMTFSALYGAAAMNNTFGLAIFMAIVYFKKLYWSFSAEVISILLVTTVVGINGARKTVTLWQAMLVGSLFPISILLVWILENVCGLD